MKRLTVPGFRWTTESIFREIDRWSLAECLNKLSEYENAGLDPEQVMKLEERDTAKVPEYEGDGYSGGEIVYDTWICPNCGEKYEVDYDDYDFCPKCGQRLKREGKENV